MQRLLVTIFSFLFYTKYIAQIPEVTSGKIERISDFNSRYVTPRNIDIWLPENYSKYRKYAVVYMHDGQMLYDPNITWNQQSWNLDEAISYLTKDNIIQNVIIVGIWNDKKRRHSDYFPQKPFENLTVEEKDTLNLQLKKIGISKQHFSPNADNYLKFLIKELKPVIDKRYSTYTDRKHTFIMGSSMGGLVSIYAICEYPETFGGAASLSTHWIGSFTNSNNAFPKSILEYLSRNLPAPTTHKIYFDCGDQTLDALYPNIQKQVDKIMKKLRFSGENWKTMYFPGENHSEESWSKRVKIPLEFLLKK